MAYDTIIIGGGIVGCTIAFYLVRGGYEVLLVERGKISQGTTSNSFAWANASTKTADRTYHDLNVAGMAGYIALEKEFGEEAPGIRKTGALEVVSKSDADGFKGMQERAAALAAFGYANRWIDNEELRRIEPDMRFADDAEALLSPDDLCINAPKFTRFMAERFVAMGGTLLEDCVAEELLASDEGVVRGLGTSKGMFETGQILLAAGPDTASVLGRLTGYDSFASRFPVNRVPGLLLTTPPLERPGLVRHIVYSAPKNELHILSEFNGGLKIGSDDIDGVIIDDRSPENLRRAGLQLLERTFQVLPQLAGTIDINDCRLGIGIRPYPGDGQSIAAPLPGADGLHIVATHSGITLAPVLGPLMAEAIIRETYPESLAPFALTRFAGFA